jgi:multiple sugar transport system ATP-binding protein
MATIEFDRVTKRYTATQTAVDAVSLAARDGEFLVLVGPSGCGKSTLLRMAAGLESITGGRVLIGGDVVNDLPPRLRDVAMVFQDYALYPHKTVRDNLGFGLRMRKVPESTVAKKVAHAAELLQIGPMLDRLPGQLSGGQRQRVAIGRAIVREPRVFFFDEPLSNLDAQLRGEMRVEIKRLQRKLGATVVYVTHDQVEAMTMADRIAVMRGGHLIQHDTPGEIYRNPRALFVGQFMGSPPMSTFALARAGGAPVWHWPDGKACDVEALGEAASRAAGAARAVTVGLRPEHLRLHQRPVDPEAVAASKAAGAIPLRGELIVVEPLGAETLVTLDAHGARIVVKSAGGVDEQPGQMLTAWVDSSALKFFDADSGLALR